MSLKSESVRSIQRANNHLGGANSTKKQRKTNCRGLVEWCFKNNRPLLSIKDVTFEQVQSYFLNIGLQRDQAQDRSDFEEQFFKANGVKPLSVSTLHNILGSLRRAITALKGDPDKSGITAAALGLAQKSREGKKLPVTDEVFLKVIDSATAAGEEGFVLCLKVERYFGHRGLEAIMAPNELKKYALEAAGMLQMKSRSSGLDDCIALPALKVRDGTKGGRPRQTVCIEKYARESLQVIGEVMKFLISSKHLIEGKSPGLKSARAKYCALARKFGLVGHFSPHSLRYRYAVDKLCEMRDAGVSLEDASVLCAAFLGHGPTRGQLIRSVYGRSVVHTFPVKRKRKDFAAAEAEIASMIKQHFPTEDVTNSQGFVSVAEICT